MKIALHNIWTGFYSLSIIVFIIAALIAIVFGIFYLLIIAWYISFCLLGKTLCAILWTAILFTIISYGLGKEINKRGS